MKAPPLIKFVVLLAVGGVVGFLFGLGVAHTRRPIPQDEATFLQSLLSQSGGLVNDLMELDEPEVAILALNNYLETIELVRQAGWPTPVFLDMKVFGAHTRLAQQYDKLGSVGDRDVHIQIALQTAHDLVESASWDPRRDYRVMHESQRKYFGRFQTPESILTFNSTSGNGDSPDGAANESQLIRSATNQTSPAAGSRR